MKQLKASKTNMLNVVRTNIEGVHLFASILMTHLTQHCLIKKFFTLL